MPLNFHTHKKAAMLFSTTASFTPRQVDRFKLADLCVCFRSLTCEKFVLISLKIIASQYAQKESRAPKIYITEVRCRNWCKGLKILVSMPLIQQLFTIRFSSGTSFDINARGSGRGPVRFTKQNLLVLNF